MPQEYFSDTQLADRYQVSRATIWRWHARGVLPQAIKISTGTTRWLKTEIEQRDAQGSRLKQQPNVRPSAGRPAARARRR